MSRASSNAPGKNRNGLPLWKRAFDLTLILLIAPGWLLVGAMVALIIKCGSPGPVFFRQKRVGYKGKEFTCFKFRTMKTNAEVDSHRNHFERLVKSQVPMTKLDARNDPRLVPLGALLRAGGLDELPQLLNVLRGEMSLIGPRPCIPYEYALYEPWQRRRFDAVPGLTGLWQVNGKNRTTFEEMVQLDIQYAATCSFWLDLKITCKTAPALFKQYRDLRAQRRGESEIAPRGLGNSAQSYHL